MSLFVALKQLPKLCILTGYFIVQLMMKHTFPDVVKRQLDGKLHRCKVYFHKLTHQEINDFPAFPSEEDLNQNQ